MSDINKTELRLDEIRVHNPKNKIKDSTGYRVFTVFNTIIMILVAVATLYPFLYLVAQSFTSTQAIIEGYTGIVPKGFNVDTYAYVLTRNDHEFLRYYLNTIIYTVIGTVLSLFFSSILAYPLSKPNLRINKFLSPFIIFTMSAADSWQTTSSCSRSDLRTPCGDSSSRCSSAHIM